jgi:hypothetical protein
VQSHEYRYLFIDVLQYVTYRYDVSNTYLEYNIEVLIHGGGERRTLVACRQVSGVSPTQEPKKLYDKCEYRQIIGI